MKDELHRFIGNKVEDLEKFIQEVNVFLEHRVIPPRTVYNVNLVLEEALTNIIKYGFDDQVEHRISVQLVLDLQQVRIEIIDEGREFNPLSAPPPVMKESIHDCAEGGLGIHLVRQVAETMEYERKADTNVLRLTIKVEVRPETVRKASL